jgi:hypothetical protein
MNRKNGTRRLVPAAIAGIRAGLNREQIIRRAMRGVELEGELRDGRWVVYEDSLEAFISRQQGIERGDVRVGAAR